MDQEPQLTLQPTPVRIGVIGPQDLVRTTLGVGSRFPALELIPVAYTEEAEASASCQAVAPLVEVLLFTGPVPYYRVMSEGQPGVPCIYVQLTGAGLYRAFLLNEGRFDITHLTIDTVEQAIVSEALSELGLDDSGVWVKEYRGPVSRDELVEFHQARYVSGQSSGALTYLRSAYNELVRREVPCAWVRPTPTEIASALEQALLLGQSARHQETQIVVGVVDVDGFGRLARRSDSEHALQRLKLDVQSALLQYVKEIDGYLMPSGGDEFLFFTTRGLFERYTRYLSTAPVLHKIRQEFGITVSMGVGFGRTAHQAAAHARAALEAAKAAGGNACYVVLDDRRLVGPLGAPEPSIVELRETASGVEALARESGLTVASTARLLRLAARFKGELFTVQELAGVLSVTIRSAQRVINALVLAGYARAAGGERHVGRGRPRQVYSLQLHGREVKQAAGDGSGLVLTAEETRGVQNQ